MVDLTLFDRIIDTGLQAVRLGKYDSDKRTHQLG